MEFAESLIRIRPRDDTAYVSQNETVFASDRDGFLRGGFEHGLFFRQTRLLSHYGYLINGQKPLPVSSSNVHQHTWLGYYIAAPEDIDDYFYGTIGPGGKIAQQTLELRLSRSVADGVHEDIDLTNFTQREQHVQLQLEIDGDFADVEETRKKRQQKGTLQRTWKQVSDSQWELFFDYHVEQRYSHQGGTGTASLHRGATIRFNASGNAPHYDERSVTFAIHLAPRASWHACLTVIPHDEGLHEPVLYKCHAFAADETEYDVRRKMFLSESAQFEALQAKTLAPLVSFALERAKRDLAALRLNSLDKGPRSWTMAAGLPVYLALFGRDTLTSSWQASMLGPAMMQGTLIDLANLQGTRVDDWRDEQPGRMLHQADTGPLATLNLTPLGRFYSSITTSGFYPFVVTQLWHWTGNEELVRPLIEPAMRALRWLEEYADVDRDGFYEYDTHSKMGNQNQGWKDSGDAIVYEDGRNVESPIATCEEQAFVYVAKLHMSELLWSLGDKDVARRFYHEAEELKKRFNEAFWMEDEKFFAMALDSEKRKVRSIGSNAGHCIATGIVDKSLIEPTANRLFADDMFSGWGVRTLSSLHPAYNPYSYHRGSIWPVEQGTFALGFMRYGLHQYVDRISRAQFEASGLFDFRRLPELFGGHQRDAQHPFPPVYPNANSPQAWSASAMFSLVQAMLGLYPYAPLRMLIVDPHLPAWLPSLTLRQLRIGEAAVSIRFWRRDDDSSDYEVLENDGNVHVVRQPSPWSLTATWPERLKDLLVSLLPGK
jgi:glycogen debranching enzyme